MRTRKGSARRQGKRRLFNKAEGNVGGRRKLIRTVQETLIRAGAFAFRDRRARKRDFRSLWIIRINAAARERGLRYGQLIAGLKQANVELDRKMLAEIAVSDPAGFDAIVAAAKAKLA